MAMPKYEHEIRDPIHTFIGVSSEERRVIDQLRLSYCGMKQNRNRLAAEYYLRRVDTIGRDRFKARVNTACLALGERRSAARDRCAWFGG